MEVELDERLKKMQGVIESSLKESDKVLNQVVSAINNTLARNRERISDLEADNKYYRRVEEDLKKAEGSLKHYKKILWSLVGVLIASAFIVVLLI